ncbi:MAG: STAS domain-containing protein [Candidatus Melainabacteria bacterium]|nr:STAS domain-containing protein [Candidatus Melainabacteria bacterium]
MVSLKKDESVVIIGLGSALVMNELTDAVNKSLNQQERLFALDMHELKFIDSSGLGALVAQFKQVNVQGGKLVLYGLTPFVQKLVEMTKLNRVLTIASDETEAKILLSK